MKRRVLSVLLATGMIVSMLAGCGSDGQESTDDTNTADQAEDTEGTDSSDEAVSISFWSLASRKEFEDAIIEAYMEQHDNVTITATYYSTDDIKANLKVAASSGTMPDMWYNWGGSLASYYPANDLTYDLTDVAAENGWDEKYLTSALELCTLEGQLSGIPQSIATMTMWYRKDIFEQYDLEVPTTFEELEHVCEVLKENGVTPFATGGQYGWHVARYLQDLIEYYGGAEEHDGLNLMTEDWASSEAVTKALEKLLDWEEKGYFQEGFLTEDPNDCRIYVYNGTCAMIIDSQTMANQIILAEQDPSLYGFFGFPTESNADGTGRVAAYVKMTQVNKNVTDAQLEAILDFWDFYYDEASNPSYTSVEQPTAIIGASVPENYAISEGTLELMDSVGIYTQIDQALPAEVFDQVTVAQDGLATGDLTPEGAAETIQTAITSYLANN